MHEPLRLQFQPPKQELAAPGATTSSAGAPAGDGVVPGNAEPAAKPKAARKPKAAGGDGPAAASRKKILIIIHAVYSCEMKFL